MSLLALYYIQIFSYEGLTAKGNTDISARCTGCSKQDNESIPCHVQPCTGAGNATQWLNTCTMCVESWIWSVVLYKPEVALQACNHSTQEAGVLVTLNYIVSLRSAWLTKDCFQKPNKILAWVPLVEQKLRVHFVDVIEKWRENPSESLIGRYKH